ncbi:MAG: hypothetical protein EOP45_13595 [Sphingobacteriaceae bacterium]|nr:MAG: hypothetical protein EOP45_13595 [Sphingobacteriaceae bacterium]
MNEDHSFTSLIIPYLIKDRKKLDKEYAKALDNITNSCYAIMISDEYLYRPHELAKVIFLLQNLINGLSRQQDILETLIDKLRNNYEKHTNPLVTCVIQRGFYGIIIQIVFEADMSHYWLEHEGLEKEMFTSIKNWYLLHQHEVQVARDQLAITK